MVFTGISKVFDITDAQQFDTIGQFWDEMAERYGLENLIGLGYAWRNQCLYYAIGRKDGDIEAYDVRMNLPDDGWVIVKGRIDSLKAIYDEIYKGGSLRYEIEKFYEDGTCEIGYYRDIEP